MNDQPKDAPELRPGRPLRVAALAKQVPVAETLQLGADGRLRREGVDLEMNPYCRRAVAKAVELATVSGGTCTVFTLGPRSAEEVLREAVAWGADTGVHLCDEMLAGSDTLATSRALAAALEREGPFDVVLVGRNTTDGDTGQVGPEIAQLLDLPFAEGVRRLDLEGDRVIAGLEHDDGWEDVELSLPAILSVAERLCDPCKADVQARRSVSADKLRRLSAADLGGGPWGEQGSPTRVGPVRVLSHSRLRIVLSGSVESQVRRAIELLDERRALTRDLRPEEGAAELTETAVRSMAAGVAPAASDEAAPLVVGVILEAGRPQVDAELIGAAARVAAEIGGEVVAFRPPAAPAPSAGSVSANGGSTDGPPFGEPAAAPNAGALGADHVVNLVGEHGGQPSAEDVAAALIAWAHSRQPWAMLAPSTAFGREVAGRLAAALGAGLVGDAIGLEVVDGELVAAKPGFCGALVADITYSSDVRLATVRPGVLPVPPRRLHTARPGHLVVGSRSRVRSLSRKRDDDVEVLARADAVVGVGAGVLPDEYGSLEPLATLLDAEMAATRKVTDRGWAPRARQVGVTGRTIAPRLYVAIGLRGTFNHMVGVRGAATVLAVNPDPAAPVFAHADIGIVGNWHDVVPVLEAQLRERLAPGAPVARDPAG